MKLRQDIFIFFGILLIVLLALVPIKLVFASENQPDNRPVGYEIIGGNSIVHLWNQILVNDSHINQINLTDYGQDYYINLTNGLQLTNHYQNYWSDNELCVNISSIGYYCTDTLPRFEWKFTTDNISFVNVRGNRTIAFTGGRRADISVSYYLFVNATNISFVPNIRMLSGSIPYNVTLAWKYTDIRIGMNVTENYLMTYPDIENGTIWKLNETKNATIIGNSQYLRQLYFYRSKFNQSNPNDHDKLVAYFPENATILIHNESGEFNSPVTIYVPLGNLSGGQNKNASFGWIDARIARCSLGWTFSQIQLSFTVNGSLWTDINETYTDSDQWFNISVYPLSSPAGSSCNGYYDNRFTSGGSDQIDTVYDWNVFGNARSVFKNVSALGFPGQGGEYVTQRKYNMSVQCGVFHSSGDATAGYAAFWWGGGYDETFGVGTISCIDAIKPYLISVVPANNTAFDDTQSEVFFNLTVGDNTNVKEVALWENRTNGDGTFKKNRTQTFGISGAGYLNYVYSLAFRLNFTNGSFAWYVTYNDTNQPNGNVSKIYYFSISKIPNILFVAPTDNDFTNTTRNYTFINVSTDQSVTNATLEWCRNGADCINISMDKKNGTVWYYNKTDIFSSYTYRVWANNTFNQSNVTAWRNITFWLIFNMSFVAPTDNDTANITDRNWTLINASLSSSLVDSCMLEWGNATVRSNQSMPRINATICTINMSNLATGNYSYRVWANDSGGRWNMTEVRTLTMVSGISLPAIILLTISFATGAMLLIFRKLKAVAVLYIASISLVALGLLVFITGVTCEAGWLCHTTRTLFGQYDILAFLLFVVLVFGSIINIIDVAAHAPTTKRR